MLSRSLIDRLTGFATARPLPVIVVVGLLTGVALVAVRDLRLGGSIYELFPDAPGPIADLGAHARLFASKQQLVALVSGPDAERTTKATRELAAALAASPLVREVQGGLDLGASAAALSRSLLLLIDEGRWPEAQRRLTSGLQRQVTRLRRMLLAPVGPDRALLTHDPLLLSELLVPAEQRDHREERSPAPTAATRCSSPSPRAAARTSPSAGACARPSRGSPESSARTGCGCASRARTSTRSTWPRRCSATWR